MKTNAQSAVSTQQVLLVPYEAHHVLVYHGWMQDPAIREATASEPLSLEEEYENQQSWRTSSDKLTFIVCEPLWTLPEAKGEEPDFVRAGLADSAGRMRGDINLFLYPDEEAEDVLVAEVDVMIADTTQRRKGLGEAAVRALLSYVQAHQDELLQEHATSGNGTTGALLGSLMVKIKEANTGSKALFTKLGFAQQGATNYFGEVVMRATWSDTQRLEASTNYRELPYGGLADELLDTGSSIP